MLVLGQTDFAFGHHQVWLVIGKYFGLSILDRCKSIQLAVDLNDAGIQLTLVRQSQPLQSRVVITDERGFVLQEAVSTKERPVVLPRRRDDVVRLRGIVPSKCRLEVSQLVIVRYRSDAKLLINITAPVAATFLLVWNHICLVRALSIKLRHLCRDALTLDVQRRAVLVQANRIQLLEQLLLSCLPLLNRVLHTQVHLLKLHDLKPLLRVLILELGFQILDAIDLILFVLTELVRELHHLLLVRILNTRKFILQLLVFLLHLALLLDKIFYLPVA